MTEQTKPTPEREAEIRSWATPDEQGDSVSFLLWLIDRLRSEHAKSPCNVEGHLMLHVTQVGPFLPPVLANHCSAEWSAEATCSLCLADERLRERAFRAGQKWEKWQDVAVNGPRTDAEAIAAIPLHDGGE